MFARSLLYLLGTVSLAWIIYVSIELTGNDNKYNPVYLFSKEDSSVIVVNDLVQLDAILSLQPTTTENITLLQSIELNQKFRIYISSKRNQILLESHDVITQRSLEELFRKSDSFKITGKNSFIFNNYKGTFSKKYCHLSIGNRPTNYPIYTRFVFDKNATGALIEIKESSFSTKDIYLKEQGVFEYKSTHDPNAIGTKVNDESIFSSIISAGINSYQFYEVEYLRSKDPVFNKSPMNNWIKTGLVQIKLAGETAIISDYINGQNPINVLCEFAKLEPENDEHAHFEDIQLSNLLPLNKDVYVYLLDDYVVVSSSKSLCERILADYKLGSTISQSPSKQLEIYNKLPKKVNHRIVDGIIKQSTSIAKNTLLTTTVLSGETTAITTTPSNSLKGKDIGEAISSFYCISENKLFVITQSNKVIYFDGDAKKWTKPFNGKTKGDAEIIDLFANDKQQLLITTDKYIHLFDANGEEVNGFPIDLENENAQLPGTFYRWQGAGYFLIPIEKSRVMHFDTKGRELNIIKTQLSTVTIKPVVWASANKPFLGIYDGSKFEMIDLQTRKSFRKFDAPNITHFANKPNEIMLLGIENQHLISYNQKGEKSVFGSFENGKIVTIHQQLNNPTILIQTKNNVHLLNTKGIEWSTIHIPFNEIDDLHMHELINGNLILSIVDGIENNVYLYSTNGQKWRQESWEGSTKICFYQLNNSSFKLFTIVDKLIVEYIQN